MAELGRRRFQLPVTPPSPNVALLKQTRLKRQRSRPQTYEPNVCSGSTADLPRHSHLRLLLGVKRKCRTSRPPEPRECCQHAVVTVDLLLEVDSGGDGHVHGALSGGDAAIRCLPSGGYLEAIWSAPHRIRQLFQALRSKWFCGRGVWRACARDGGYSLCTRGLLPDLIQQAK